MADTTTSAIGGLTYVKSNTASQTGGLKVDTSTFLKLLVAQMQYQDPMEPQSNTEFVTQLAQMTSMEQMQDMSGSLSTSKAMDYVGKAIYAEVLDPDTGVTMTYAGKAEGVVLKNGEAYLVVGNYAICVDDITAIAEDTSGSTASTTTDSSAGSATNPADGA